MLHTYNDKTIFLNLRTILCLSYSFCLVSVHRLRQGLAENKVVVAFRTGGLCF